MRLLPLAPEVDFGYAVSLTRLIDLLAGSVIQRAERLRGNALVSIAAAAGVKDSAALTPKCNTYASLQQSGAAAAL